MIHTHMELLHVRTAYLLSSGSEQAPCRTVVRSIASLIISPISRSPSLPVPTYLPTNSNMSPGLPGSEGEVGPLFPNQRSLS